MMEAGGCHCGNIRFEMDGEIRHSALCHCSDCRLCAGAPMVGWVAFDETGLTVTKGETKEYVSSEHGRRHFCPDCGTGLFYYNAEFLPGIVDIQTAVFDNPDRFPPTAHIQTAEQLDWMAGAHHLPQFKNFPQ